MMELQQIEQQINEVANQILKRLGKQCDNDPHIGIAALAVAMCSLARADGQSLVDLKALVSIAHKSVSDLE